MYKYYFILCRLLLINKFSLKSLVNISIILSVSISSFIIPLTLSISNGFKSNIEDKIVQFDGYARVYSKDISTNNWDYILKHHNEYAIPFTEKE